ncbi:MAG: hypothetical protein ABSA62_16465 [Methyloceanibacter sp.]|jgi:hypothetical protein
MHFFFGVLTGVLLAVLAAFIADTTATAENPKIVNWDLAGERVSKSLDVIREEIHELTG